MIPGIASNTEITVNKGKEDLPDTKTAVGPSAPPIIPMEPAFLASVLNFLDKYSGSNKLKNALINATKALMTVNTIIIFSAFSFLMFIHSKLSLNIPFFINSLIFGLKGSRFDGLVLPLSPCSVFGWLIYFFTVFFYMPSSLPIAYGCQFVVGKKLQTSALFIYLPSFVSPKKSNTSWNKLCIRSYLFITSSKPSIFCGYLFMKAFNLSLYFCM